MYKDFFYQENISKSIIYAEIQQKCLFLLNIWTTQKSYFRDSSLEGSTSKRLYIKEDGPVTVRCTLLELFVKVAAKDWY